MGSVVVGARGHRAPEFLRRLPQDLGGVPAVFGDFRDVVDLVVVYGIHSSMGARTAGDGDALSMVSGFFCEGEQRACDACA